MFKAIGGRHFSFMVFGGSQVLMDLEPLVGLIQDRPVLHGYTHTLAGALLIGLVAALIGRPISAWVLRVLAIGHHPLTWPAAFAGAMLGTFSHLVLDAVMHSDIHPWWPFADGNGLLKIIPISSLHLLCVGLGVLGGAASGLRARRAAKS